MQRNIAVLFVMSMLAIHVAAPTRMSPLERVLEADLGRYSAETGLYVKHLTTGDEAAIRADNEFNSYTPMTRRHGEPRLAL